MSLRHRTSQTSERKPGAVRSSDIFRSFYNFCQQLSDNYHMFFNAHMWDEQHLSKMVHFIWIHMAYPYRFWLSLVENHPKTSQKHRILPSSDPLQLQGTAQRVRIWGSSSSMATQASGCLWNCVIMSLKSQIVDIINYIIDTIDTISCDLMSFQNFVATRNFCW